MLSTKPLLLATLATFLIGSSCNEIRHRKTNDDIIEAINKDICFHSFWYGTPYKLGGVATFNVVIYDGITEVWTYDLFKDRDPFLTRFKIGYVGSSPFVSSSRTENQQFVRSPDYLKKISKTFEMNVIKNCRPDKHINTDKISTIEKFVKQLILEGKNDKRISLYIVADSSLYPRSLVYISNYNQLYSMYVEPRMSTRGENYKIIRYGEVLDKQFIAFVAPRAKQHAVVRQLRLR